MTDSKDIPIPADLVRPSLPADVLKDRDERLDVAHKHAADSAAEKATHKNKLLPSGAKPPSSTPAHDPKKPPVLPPFMQH